MIECLGQRTVEAMKLTKAININRKLERRRIHWQRRSGQAKRQWFSGAIRRGGTWKRRGWGNRPPKDLPWGSCSHFSAVFWLGGFLFFVLQTGRGSVSRVEQNAIGAAEEDGWEWELFGLRFRIQDGEITIFQEKEEIKRIR